MNITVQVDVPAAMNQTAAWKYVGGRRVFEALTENYGEAMRPFLRTKGAVMWRRETLDRVLELAEAGQELVEDLSRSVETNTKPENSDERDDE